MQLRTHLEHALPHLKDDAAKENFGKDPSLRHSAVLVLFLLHPREQESELLMIRRSANPLDPHSRQLAFPGGVLEAQDEKNPVSTALRETREEIALEEDHVNVLCTMQRFSTRFDVSIVPVLAVSKLHSLTYLQKNDAEIAEILSIKWHDIVKNAVRHERYGVRGWTSMPAYACDAGFIWGASAKIIAHLEEHLSA